MTNRLTLVVTTCEKFKDMWVNQAKAIENFWPNHPKCIFITDKGSPEFKNITFLECEGNYSDRLRNGLKEIESEYILLSMDDYLLKSKIDDDKLNRLLDLISNQDAGYCKIHYARYGKVVDRKNKIKSLPLNVPYEVSLLPGIWKKECLIKVLGENKNPWQTEVSLTSSANNAEVKCINFYDRSFFKYVDIVRKGCYLRKAYKYLKANGYYVSDRKVLSRKQSFFHGLKSSFAYVLPYKVRKTLVKIFKIKSYSNSNL